MGMCHHSRTASFKAQCSAEIKAQFYSVTLPSLLQGISGSKHRVLVQDTNRQACDAGPMHEQEEEANAAIMAALAPK